MKPPKIWKRSGTESYYITIAGRQYNLGTNLKKAKDQAKLLLEEHGDASHRRGGPMLFRELVDKYLVWVEKNKAASTYIVAEGLLTKLRESVPNRLRAVSLTPQHVQDWLDSSEAKSPSTINNRITLVSGMYNWGRRNGLLQRNPIADMPRPAPRIRQEFVPPEKFQELIDACPNDQLRDFVAFMLDTGARAEEMFKMRVEHVAPKRDRIVFEIENSKGRKRSRTIFLPAAAQEIVKRAIGGRDSGPLFRNTRGVAWNRASINDSMRRLRPIVGIPKLCATMLRHSFAHARLVNKQAAFTVSKLMGHVDTKMLARRYGHIEGSDFLAEQAQAFELVKPPELKNVDGCR